MPATRPGSGCVNTPTAASTELENFTVQRPVPFFQLQDSLVSGDDVRILATNDFEKLVTLVGGGSEDLPKLVVFLLQRGDLEDPAELRCRSLWRRGWIYTILTLILGSVEVQLNDMPEETFREFSVADDGTVYHAEMSEQGMSYRAIHCP